MSNKIVNITGSYVQADRHVSVSNRYNPIQPSSVGQVMAAHGLELATLSTGRARHIDKVDFQRTLARYRGPEVCPGVNLDIIYDSKKMGRGVDRLMLGIYRMICTNGLFVGSNFFVHAIRHSGNTNQGLNEGIDAALAMRDKLAETIARMQSTLLTPEAAQNFAQDAARLLVPSTADQVAHRLLTVRRAEDQSADLWTVFNRVQENAMYGRNVTYTMKSIDEFGRESTRAMHTRAIKPNTGKDAEFNQNLFDAALKLAA